VAGGTLITKTGVATPKPARHLTPRRRLPRTTRQKYCQGSLSRLDNILAVTGFFFFYLDIFRGHFRLAFTGVYFGIELIWSNVLVAGISERNKRAALGQFRMRCVFICIYLLVFE
jgi:hypothetical protein